MGFEANRILDKALQLFREYGIRSVSMDDIAGSMGISKKTLYQSFEDKNDLVEKVEDYRYSLRQEQFNFIYKQRLSSIEEMISIHAVLKNLIGSYSKAFEHDLKKYFPELYEKHNERRIIKMKEALKKNIKKGIVEGVYRSDINIDLIADYKTSYILFMTERKTFEKGFGLLEYFNEIFKLHMNGILNEKGMKEYSEKTEINKVLK